MHLTRGYFIGEHSGDGTGVHCDSCECPGCVSDIVQGTAMRKYSARHFPARSAVTLFQTDKVVRRKLCARLLQSQVSLVRFEVFKRGRFAQLCLSGCGQTESIVGTSERARLVCLSLSDRRLNPGSVTSCLTPSALVGRHESSNGILTGS